MDRSVSNTGHRAGPAGPGPARRVSRGSHDRWVLPGVLVVTTVTGVVGSLGAPLIPQIAQADEVSLVTAQWALTAPLVVAAVASPLIGRLGVGRRRRPVLLWCLALVALGTLLAALPLGFGALLAGRVLQGLAFGIVPLAFSVARTELSPGRARSAFAMISVANVVSAGLGFPATALVAEVAGVAGAFWFGFAMTGFAFLVAVRTIPRTADDVPARLDWMGAVLLGVGTCCVLLAVSQAPTWGWTATPTTALFATGTMLLAACVVWLRRVPHPLVDLRVATRRGVLGANVAGLLAGCGMYVMIALVMIVVQAPREGGVGLGRSVAVAGLMLTPYAVASVSGAWLALRLARVLAPDLLLPLGCLGFGLANLGLALWHDELWQLTLVLLVGGIGSGMTFNSIPWLLLRHVPEEEIASATGFNLVLRFLGMSAGSAIALTILDVTAPPGVQASAQGYLVGGLAGLGVSLLAALICLVLGRPRPASGQREPDPADPASLIASARADRKP